MDAVIVKLEKLFQWFFKVHIDPTVTIKTVSCALLEVSSLGHWNVNLGILPFLFILVVGMPIQEVVQSMRTSYLTRIHSMQTYSPPLFICHPHIGWLYIPQAGTGGI